MTTDSNSMDVVDYNYAGADKIASQAIKAADDVGPVLVSSLANVDKLDTSSTFGRISADEIGSRLSQHGIVVLESRMRDVFVVRPGGEFMLSDETRLVAKQRRAASVLVGTYADSGNVVLVSLKLVRVSDDAVVGSSDYSVPMSNATHDALIGSNENLETKDTILGRASVE